MYWILFRTAVGAFCLVVRAALLLQRQVICTVIGEWNDWIGWLRQVLDWLLQVSLTLSSYCISCSVTAYWKALGSAARASPTEWFTPSSNNGTPDLSISPSPQSRYEHSNRDAREWLFTFPLPPISVQLIPIPSNSHSQFCNQFPFPWDSHKAFPISSHSHSRTLHRCSINYFWAIEDSSLNMPLKLTISCVHFYSTETR